MPQSALRLVNVDHVLPVAEIAPALVRLAREPVTGRKGEPMVDEEERMNGVIREDIAELARDGRPDELSIYTCPDCGGAMWQASAGPPLQFRCHVGHAYAPEVLLGQKSEELEGALWSCVRLLTEKATLTRQLAVRTRAGGGNGGTAARIEEQAESDERHARVIRELLEAMPSPTDQAGEVAALLDRQVLPGGGAG